ncbi:MAG TPA: hydrogenase 4 subunit F [Candidatus Acidoferrales bacterium]|nr:hydrogenase 4 subunit F [Candidatus Acidoferrales bacterium]
MILLLPLAIPAVGAGLILAFNNPRAATRLALVLGGMEIAALGSVVWQVHAHGELREGRYLRADSLSAFFLMGIALVAGLVLVYASGYLRHMGEGRFSSPRWFYALVFLFLFTMISVCLAASLGLLWIMMEGTTLASALLVGFYNTEGAVEAGWKYLIVCTVGIAFALFGTIVLYLAAVKAGMNPASALDWVSLMDAAQRIGFDPHLVKLAFVFVIVGYGTKIGFVPMHSWLPDAHAEAPTPISALLSAVLLNCAMYALMRYDAIVSLSVGPAFPHILLLIFGVMSMVVAGLLILVQRNLKRLMAYSSIEHMGIIAIGLGLGGPLGLFGALLHTFNHSVAKSLLFFGAGNIRHNTGTLRIDEIKGISRTMPQTTAALLVGGLAIVGLPPFSLFVSEFAILSEAFTQAHYLVVILFLVILSVVFGGFAFHFFRMLGGEPDGRSENSKLIPSEYIAMGIAALCVLFFGVRIPYEFGVLLREAMAVLR